MSGPTREGMLKYMEEAKQIIANWPEWKQKVLRKDFLDSLREQNRSRSEKWTGGADTAEFKAVELAGETGELMNAIKKQIRFQQGWKGGVNNRENLADEFGDVLICLDRLADAFGIDLAEVAAAKFNKTSEKHGFVERL